MDRNVDALVVEVRVEQDVDARELADRLVDDLQLLAHRDVDRLRGQRAQNRWRPHRFHEFAAVATLQLDGTGIEVIVRCFRLVPREALNQI